MTLAISTFQTIGFAILGVTVIGYLVYIFFNVRASRPEIGAEIELAANRGTLPDDETLEGSRLEQVQSWGVVFLVIIAIGLPVYWLREAGRQAGADEQTRNISISRGERHYLERFQCVNCHGGNLRGGAAPAIIDIPDINDDVEGSDVFKVSVSWDAPSLVDIFKRFDTEIEDPRDSTELRQILVFGRSPVMPPWGLAGGGSGTDQHIQEVIDYLWDNQISDEEAVLAATADFDEARADAANADKSDGQILFEQHCARCHTPFWPVRGQVTPGAAGGGRYGPALNGPTLELLWPDPADQVEFIQKGAADNVPYGDSASGIQRGGGYGMPGFGRVLSPEQIAEIVEYVRGLEQDTTVDPTVRGEG